MAILEPLGRPANRSHTISTSQQSFINLAPELSTLQVVTSLNLYSGGDLSLTLRSSEGSGGVIVLETTISNEGVVLVGSTAEEIRFPPGFKPILQAENTGASDTTLNVGCAGYYRLQGRL